MNLTSPEGLQQVLFWILSSLMLGFAVLVVLNRNPVASALSLVVTMVFTAMILFGAQAYFLATLQILVYAGAVMVLFLFIIMLLDLQAETRRKLNWGAAIGSVAVLAGLMYSLPKVLLSPSLREVGGGVPPSVVTDDVRQLGQLLFTNYILPFELTAALLLVAIMGVILLSKNRTDKGVSSTQQETDK